MKNLIYFISLLVTVTAFSSQEQFFYNNGKKVYINQSSDLTRTVNKQKITFRTTTGQDIILTKNIIIKLYNKNDITNILKQYNLTIIKQYSETTFLLSTQNTINSLDIANKLYDDNRTIYSQPDFRKKIKLR